MVDTQLSHLLCRSVWYLSGAEGLVVVVMAVGQGGAVVGMVVVMVVGMLVLMVVRVGVVMVMVVVVGLWGNVLMACLQSSRWRWDGF